MITVIQTEPTVEPITTAEAKTHLRIEHSNHDTIIAGYIKAARLLIEARLHRVLVEQTWKAYYQGWPNKYFEIPYPPLQSVTHIKYTDTDDDVTTWSSDEYEVDTDSEPGRVLLAYNYTWPNASLHPKNPIEIQFVAGYDDDGGSPADYRANIPQNIKDAMKVQVEILYDRPNDSYMKVLEGLRDSFLNRDIVYTL